MVLQKEPHFMETVNKVSGTRPMDVGALLSQDCARVLAHLDHRQIISP